MVRSIVGHLKKMVFLHSKNDAKICKNRFIALYRDTSLAHIFLHMAYGIWHMAYGHRTIYDKYGQVGYPLKEQYKCSSAVLLVKLDGYSMFLQGSMHILASFLERKKAIFFVALTHPVAPCILRGFQNSKKIVLWNTLVLMENWPNK